MQIRFRKYNEEEERYKLLGYVDVDDYDTTFKLLTYMKEHQCDFAIELNKSGILEDVNFTSYNVENVSLCIPSLGNKLDPHIVVDLEEW